MRFVMFYHSLVSDWNHGNAHFLRGVASELLDRGHQVTIFEPEDGWSRRNLVADHGPASLEAFAHAYPHLRSTSYDMNQLDLDAALAGADVVLVHEWNEPRLVAQIGEHRRHHRYRLFFHDTHHRAVSDPQALGRLDLSCYDGALVFGRVLARVYHQHNWCNRVFVWHEAADTRVFQPLPRATEPTWDLVWVGNWGDGERGEELEEFLIDPVRRLGLHAQVFGVRYPVEAQQALRRAGIGYGGYLPNFEVPGVFASARVTVHVPRRHYAQTLDGIPTIRPFEAMACGIPLVSAPWSDSEGLFAPGLDFLVAHDNREMRRQLEKVLGDADESRRLAKQGRRTILDRHTCAHRVDQLLNLVRTLDERPSDLHRAEA
jgi:spore maturation protein CgeB